MTMTVDDLRSCIGRDVVDRAGERAGRIESVFYDTKTNEPAWLAVHTGLFGRHSTLVPLAGARTDGEMIVVPYEKDVIKSAPDVEDDRPIGPDQASELMRHYGLKGGMAETPTTTGKATETPTRASDQQRPAPDRAPSTAEGTDDAMTRSEEELFIGTESTEIGRARLRKWIETEPVDRVVTVTHEEARVLREPITEDNVDRAMQGPDLTENEYEVVLHEERAVVEKRVVPKERVRLETERIDEQTEIHDELRKERIEFEDSSKDTAKGHPR